MSREWDGYACLFIVSCYQDGIAYRFTILIGHSISEQWKDVIQGVDMSSILPNNQQEIQASLTDAFVVLGPTLKIDLDSAVIINEQREILLTAREIAVMRILVTTMLHSRSYLSAQDIANRINIVHTGDPGHCIEQTISQLRYKLGEKAHSPHILRGRRGLGYRLFPLQC